MVAYGSRDFVTTAKFLSALQNLTLYQNDSNNQLFIDTVKLASLLRAHGLN